MADHVDHDMMLEHDRCMCVLGDFAERAGIVRIRIVALFELHSLIQLAAVCMHAPRAQNEHETDEYDGCKESRHGLQR